MRVLVIHEPYGSDYPSGENEIVKWEAKALEKRGISIQMLRADPDYEKFSDFRKNVASLCTVYSARERRRAADAIDRFRPDLVHVHNIWPVPTPSVYFSCRDAEVPVVQTLHNYRLVCNGDFLSREGQTCTLCVGKRFGWPGVWHRCTWNSLSRSLAKATMTSAHTLANTWNRLIDRFIAPSESMSSVACKAGIEPSRLRIRPSFTPDPGYRDVKGEYFCFAGRLNEEKGIGHLIKIWRELPGIKLKIAGGGPMVAEVEQLARTHPDVEYLGLISPDRVFELMRGAIATLLPSIWDEPCPVVLVQSLAVGTPVIASDYGSRSESVIHGVTGMIYEGGDLDGLSRLIRQAWEQPGMCRAMSQAARRAYTDKFAEAENVEHLIDIYREVLADRPEHSGKRQAGKLQP